ncbi:MAG: hypothetical protein FWC76_06190 [Defluviitaleaceae bacterium]|nr:hypothetical protein [Defluviitaleaceae bacterium]
MSQFPNNQGGAPTPPPMPPMKQPGENLATAALVIGIISLVIYAFNIIVPFLEVITGVVGIVLAIQAGNLGFKGGKRTGGLVTSIIATALGGVYWVACFLCAAPMMLF